MIRGISRQIIEVSKTRNEYFERALFFVNPIFSDAERAVLEREARKMLRELGVPTATARRRKKWYMVLRMLAAALCGGSLTAAVMMVL